MNTKPPHLPPPYTPAPYLAQGSFLTSSQLVNYFQDFYGSLEYITNAPEYVFERLVGNLNHAFTAITEQDRDRNVRQYPNIVEEMKALELSNSQLKAELAELKAMISTIPGNHPAIGSFHTSEIRSRDKLQKKNGKVVQFTRSHLEPPHIAIGLSSFEFSGAITLNLAPTSIKKDTFQIGAITLNSAPTTIKNDTFQINIDSWCDTMLSASCTWLEVDSNDPDFQCGRFNIAEDHRWDKPKLETTCQITFPRPYSAQPQVVVWIYRLGFHCNTDRRLHVYATDVTKTGFKLHVDTWGDSVLHDAGVSWVACTAEKPNVFTGSFSTSDLRSGEFPCLKDSGYVRFGNGTARFAAPPRVISAINRIDISSKYDMRLSLRISDITAAGMAWNLDGWSDTILYSAAASFIALA